MKYLFVRATTLSLALAGLGGAAIGAPRAAPVEVTRVHLDASFAPAATALEPRPRGDLNAADMAQYTAAVARQLNRLRFKAGAAGASPYVAVVDVLRGTSADVSRRAGPLIGAAAQTASPAPAGEVTLLSVQLQRRTDGSVVWEGRAQATTRGTATAMARRLAAALFRGFPGQSGATVSVR